MLFDRSESNQGCDGFYLSLQTTKQNDRRMDMDCYRIVIWKRAKLEGGALLLQATPELIRRNPKSDRDRVATAKQNCFGYRYEYRREVVN